MTTPSIMTSRKVTVLRVVFDLALTASTSLPSSGFHDTKLFMGKKRAFPPGIVHSRTDVPPKLPARNQMAPLCPRVQSTAPSSRIGFVANGNCTAQFHQSPANSLYDFPKCLTPGSKTLIPFAAQLARGTGASEAKIMQPISSKIGLTLGL